IGRFHLHANYVRFERPQKPNSSIPRGPNHSTPKEMNMENSKKSFLSVLKHGSQSHVTPEITKPALVLDESCIKEFDFGMSLMGRAKDVSAIPNLPFLFEFESLASKEKFLNHTGIGSWFNELIQATNSFENDERIVWISIEGLPIRAWTPNTFSKIASLWGEYVEWEDADLKSFSCKHLCLKTKMNVIINESQKVIIQGKVYWIRVKELDAWFPNFQEDDQDDLSSDGESHEGDVANKADNIKSDVDRVSESSFMHENDTAHKDINSCKTGEVGSHSEDPFNIYGGSILDLTDELVTVGQTMGYNMAGLGNKAKRRWIKELCQKYRINFASIQETKAKSIVSTCDYFVALMGTWTPTSSKLLIISVYTPQELNERRDLWDYLRTFIDRWEVETVIIGDFNKVHSEHERFGSTFNRQGAIAFNNFISSTCLIDLPLEGYVFTWAHKSASKMSKLDRYLILEGSLDLFLHLKKKLQALKIAIKVWSKEANKRSNERKIKIQQNLSEVDKLIDQGKSNDDILNKRIMLLNDLQELNNRNAMEILKKPKSDGPLKEMKTPNTSMYLLRLHFLNRLSTDQVEELERTVTYEEVKMAVWDYGTNKSPGPDGFSFEFYPLIPKIQDAKFVKDFRPISLIGSVYKIIAKILANRLCLVLPYLISDVQSAFVANRQILDGPFILNELLSWCKFKKLNGMIFKVDFEKAFDSVKWDYLDETLKAFGFCSKWRNWISSCLNNVMGSVLVNGSPTLEFQFHKGLKQGLKINLHKSKLIGIGVSSNVVEAAASLIGCSMLTTPFNYLGVKVGSNMSRITSWDDVISKVSSRLSKWKLKLLSIGGRLTLLKSDST
ncbi:RNA-directed DNA polymerase, eukaryota, partial [Tanacetum coccineum]